MPIFDTGASETICNLLDTLGIDAVPVGESGECGTCVTDIFNGDPEHRDGPLSAGEQGKGKPMRSGVSRVMGDTIVRES